jgi:DNA polymerase-1
MEEVILPNIRKIFIPDSGYDIYDCDLAGADAQVVAWEAEDADLKAAFRAGLDVHSKNASDMWGGAFDQLQGSARKKKRQSCKHAVHGTNYGGTARTIAAHPSINWTVHEADQFQKRWFQIHPAIRRWHTRVQADLDRAKTVANPFGYRRVFFDRPDAVFPEALAWVPQSTVALVSFYGALQLEKASPWIEMLLQNHDSIVFQAPHRYRGSIAEIKRGLEIVVPYSDPLTIPWGVARSEVSWGDCEKVEAS